MSTSNAWSRGRPVMSDNPSRNQGPPPGLGKGRGDVKSSWGPTADANNNGGRGQQQQQQRASEEQQSSTTDDPVAIARERYLHLLLSVIGHSVCITKTNGEIVEGIFHTFCPFDTVAAEGKNVYVLKGARSVKKLGEGGEASSSDTTAIQEGSTLLISSQHVLKLHVKSIRLDNPSAAASNNNNMFRTDTEISNKKSGSQRLIAAGSVWTSGGDTAATFKDSNMSASSTIGNNNSTSSARGGMFQGGTNTSNNNNTASSSWRKKKHEENSTSTSLSGTIGTWDQFSANEKQFNVKASFDENLYTTKLEIDALEDKEAKLAEAERIAREIEGTTSDNVHLMEERNQKISMDYDEEDLYSGVLKKKMNDDAKNDDKDGKNGNKSMNYAAATAGGKKDEEEKGRDAATVADTRTPTESDEAKKDREEDKKEDDKPKLNPNAKEFTFNPAAKSFTPSFTGAPAPAVSPPVAPPQGTGMHPGMMNYHPGMQYGMQPGGGMMPVPMNPQMRQPYPYPPVPGQPNMQPQPTPNQGEDSSEATGEGSSPPGEPNQHPPQQQYVQPGGYPGYPYPYGGTVMHQHPNFHQMQVPMPGYQRMYPGMAMPPHGAGAGGVGGMHRPGPPQYYHPASPYQGYDEGVNTVGGGGGHHKQYQRKNSKGGNSNGGGYKGNKRGSYGGRGGGGGRGGYNYAEGRQSEDDGSPITNEGEVEAENEEAAAAAT